MQFECVHCQRICLGLKISQLVAVQKNFTAAYIKSRKYKRDHKFLAYRLLNDGILYSGHRVPLVQRIYSPPDSVELYI